MITWRGLGLRGGFGFGLRSGFSEAESQTACENLEDDNRGVVRTFKPCYFTRNCLMLLATPSDSLTHCTEYRAVATDVLTPLSTPFIAEQQRMFWMRRDSDPVSSWLES